VSLSLPIIRHVDLGFVLLGPLAIVFNRSHKLEAYWGGRS